MTFSPRTYPSLNPEQRAAVETTEGPLLIFAGAGSGKTRVLTHRMAHIVSSKGVHPDEILAVTFTNKAAREMRERVVSIFSQTRDGVGIPNWVCTFHALGVRILRRHAHRLGFTSNFVIYDSANSLSLLKRVYKQLKVNSELLDPKLLRATIDQAKNSYVLPSEFAKKSGLPLHIAELAESIYTAYQKELQSSNAMDFGDLLCNLVTLFKLENNILRGYQQQFKYIMIDEYQDTNFVQFLLIEMLAFVHKNLCVVGDDDQSIYAFRGASIQNILNFNKHFPGTKTITLHRNYRSSGNILSAANSIIEHNRQRQPKRMTTENPSGDKISVYCGGNEVDEANFVAREIVLAKSVGVPLREIAILYRTNAQSRALEESLRECALPYEIYGGNKFYDRKEIKDILAYARLAVNEKDDEALLRIINTPTRGLGAKTVSDLVGYSHRNGLSVMATIHGMAQGRIDVKASPKLKSAIDEFSRIMTVLTEDARSLNIQDESLSDGLSSNATGSEALNLENPQTVIASGDPRGDLHDRIEDIAIFLKRIADDTGYITRLSKEHSEESDSRIENILELCEVAVSFSRRAVAASQFPSIQDFLDRASLISDLDEENISTSTGEGGKVDSNNGSRDFVSLMTLHLAKGLEFDRAFIVGFEEGILPHSRSIDSVTELEEERRLCYVGITRARKKLYLTRAASRRQFSRNWFSGYASRFVYDLPPEVLEERNRGFLG